MRHYRLHLFFLGGICNFDNWIKGKTSSKVPNALLPVAPFSKKSSTDIINYVKQKLNPNDNNHEYNQSNKESIKKTIQDKFDCSVDELTENYYKIF